VDGLGTTRASLGPAANDLNVFDAIVFVGGGLIPSRIGGRRHGEERE
jgi:hypothetical protein